MKSKEGKRGSEKNTHIAEVERHELAAIFPSLISESAHELMDRNFIVVEAHATLPTIARKIGAHVRETGETPSVLVVNRRRAFLGSIPLPSLVVSSPKRHAENLVATASTFSPHVSRRRLIEETIARHLDRLVIVDTEHRPVGIVHAKDLLRAMHEERSHSLAAFAGVQEERALDSIFTSVRLRYKWLLINLATAFLATFTVSLFESTLSKMVILAAYMPVVAGMGGNAATQSIAVAVRGLALGEIKRHAAWRVIRKEIAAGFLNGILIGVVAAAFAILTGTSPVFGLVLGSALIINHINAGFFGSLIPIILRSLGFDPALSASIFVTTATDVIGFFVFLGLASLLLV